MYIAFMLLLFNCTYIQIATYIVYTYASINSKTFIMFISNITLCIILCNYNYVDTQGNLYSQHKQSIMKHNYQIKLYITLIPVHQYTNYVMVCIPNYILYVPMQYLSYFLIAICMYVWHMYKSNPMQKQPTQL